MKFHSDNQTDNGIFTWNETGYLDVRFYTVKGYEEGSAYYQPGEKIIYYRANGRTYEFKMADSKSLEPTILNDVKELLYRSRTFNVYLDYENNIHVGDTVKNNISLPLKYVGEEWGRLIIVDADNKLFSFENKN